AHGFEPVACRVVREGPAPDPAALRRAAESAEDYDWLVAASARAVAALLAARDSRALPAALRGAAVGARTARALRDAGLAQVTVAEGAETIGEAWRRARPAAAVIASPSAARALVGALGAETLRSLAAIVAIGATSGAALEALGVPSHRAAESSFEAAAAGLA